MRAFVRRCRHVVIALHAECRRFESVTAHQPSLLRSSGLASQADNEAAKAAAPKLSLAEAG
jgi:hypothetical protein